ncbi:MAG: asparagine synthase (glutamine-hydrolyzing) [Nitrospirota bacterium]
MCGIAGISAFDGRRISTAELKAMTDRMIQRGPDDAGFFTEGSVGLGMRRLAIIDVEGGHQPLSNEGGDIQLVLNGEIYNHLELRRQLVSRGHVFRTGSDSEVLLHLYEDKGVDALSELNGMFAFALHDSRRQALWIARDRLGIKPLFYAVSREQIAFASDIKALRAVYATHVEPKQVLKYLALGYAPGAETVWHGIRKLLPAHYLWIEGGKVTLEKYWSLTGIGSWHGSIEEATKQFEVLLQDAIRLQLRSDVPLGVFLSGGLDSSTIVALAAEQLTEPLRTFTICFEGKGSADDGFARETARRYATSHMEIPMGPAEAAAAMDELLPMMDEPLSDSAVLPAYWLSKIARDQGVKVLLNGAGGDEILGGYVRHWPARVGSPTWISENLPQRARRIVAGAWSVFQPHRAIRASDPVFAWAASVSSVNFHAARQLLADPGDYTDMVKAVRSEYGGIVGSPATLGYAYTRMSLDLHRYLPEDVLSLTDKATMAASVEGRVPLIDHRLVEFAFSLPVEINLLGCQSKGLLKRVMVDRLPEDLLSRKKEGFSAPTEAWLRNSRGVDLVGELLGARTPVLDALIDPGALESLLASSRERSRSAGMLFALFVFNRWHRLQLG